MLAGEIDDLSAGLLSPRRAPRLHDELGVMLPVPVEHPLPQGVLGREFKDCLKRGVRVMLTEGIEDLFALAAASVLQGTSREV